MQDAVICVALLCLLVLITWAMVKFEQKHPAPMPPAINADEDADALPFGPIPYNVD
ncbi:hypothetical protein [Spirosoma jeollabukense]